MPTGVPTFAKVETLPDPSSGEHHRTAYRPPGLAALPSVLPESLPAQSGETVTVTRVITCVYDPLNRLTGAQYSTAEAFEYVYDAVGNRTALTSTTPLSGTVVTTYTYDIANRLTDRAVSDGRTYTYDWSDRGQLLTEWTQGYPVRTFTYDGAGQMVEATVFTQTTRFRYNGLGARVAVEVVGYGTTTVTLDYAAGNRILAEETLTSTTLYLHGRDCLGELRDGAWLYYLSDAEGLVRQGTDAQGDLVSAWLFDPDGAVLEGPDGPVSHLVCGGVYDQSTGLLYKGGRYFDPMLGIWLALLPLIVVRRKKKRRGFPWISMVLVMVCALSMLTACGKEQALEHICTDVKKPTLNNIEIVSVGNVQVFSTPDGGGDWRFQFGSTPDSSLDRPPAGAGVIIEANFDVEEGVSGTLEWVQDVITRRVMERTDRFVQETGNAQRIANGDGKTRTLDTWDPYKSAENFPIDSVGTFSSRIWDIPVMSLPLLPPLKYAMIEDKFRSFVMWRPAGSSCRVPLGMITWEWRVEVENTKTKELVPNSANWVIISQSIPQVETKGGITNQTPILSPNVTDFEWQTVP